MKVYLLNPSENPLTSNLISRTFTYGLKNFVPKYSNLTESLHSLGLLGAIITPYPFDFLHHFERISQFREFYIKKWASKYPNANIVHLDRNTPSTFLQTDILLLTSKCVKYEYISEVCTRFPGKVMIVLDDHIHVYKSEISTLYRNLTGKVQFLRPLGAGATEILFPELSIPIQQSGYLPPIGIPQRITKHISASKRNGKVLSVGSITLQDIKNDFDLSLYKRYNISCPHPDRLWLYNNFNVINCLDSISYIDDQRSFANNNFIENLTLKLTSRIGKMLYYSRKLNDLFKWYTYVICPSNFYGVIPQLIYEAMSHGAIIIGNTSLEYRSLGFVDQESYLSIPTQISASNIDSYVSRLNSNPPLLDSIQANSLRLIKKLQPNSQFTLDLVRNAFTQ